jgi:hypothetical protein
MIPVNEEQRMIIMNGMDRYLGKDEFKVLLGALKVLGEKSEISFMGISEECVRLERHNKDHYKIWNS